jgi:hypothetical protein
MARDDEHFFMCFLGIWTSSFEMALFSSRRQGWGGGEKWIVAQERWESKEVRTEIRK